MFTNRYIRKFAKNTVTKCADILKFSAAYFPPNAHVLNKH